LPVLHLNREAMNREITLDMWTGRRDAVVETGDHRRQVDAVGADATIELVVGIGVIAQHQPAECWRTPIPADASESKLCEFPLSTAVTIFGATVDLSVFAA